ncbi:unnamed protein product [Urochloa humidicola]
MVGQRGSLSSATAGGLGSSSAGPAARLRRKARARGGAAEVAVEHMRRSLGSSSPPARVLPLLPRRAQIQWTSIGGGASKRRRRRLGPSSAPAKLPASRSALSSTFSCVPTLPLLFLATAELRRGGAVKPPSVGTIGEKGRPGIERIECGRRSSRSWRPASSSPIEHAHGWVSPPPVWIGGGGACERRHVRWVPRAADGTTSGGEGRAAPQG